MNTIEEKFGHRIRLRVCGLLIENSSLLLINHSGLQGRKSFWAPPGGGVHFGEPAGKAMIREFKEETGLDITVENHLFTYEFIKEPLHAIELFFMVKKTGGVLKKGYDPELGKNEQIIEDIRYVNSEELATIDPKYKHGILNRIKKFDDLNTMSAFIFDDLG